MALFTESLKGKIKEFGAATVMGAVGGVGTAHAGVGAGIRGRGEVTPPRWTPAKVHT